MFIVQEKPKSITAEAYRTLRTNIQYSSFDKEIKSIVVTSSEPGEGKSTVAGNIALSFAQDDKSVILIDCDLRRPTVHKNFRLSNTIGLSEVLVGKVKVEDAIQTYNENLHVLTSGTIPPNPAEMLSSNVMTNLINALTQKYDMVIIDSAPLQAVTDAQILSTVFVVRAERTKIDSVKEAKNLLDKVNANILGTVLHVASETRGKYYYYYAQDGNKKKDSKKK